MNFDEIHKQVGHVPFISARNARRLYDLITTEDLSEVLELGIAHGTATCYMAAAMHELGRGTITAVDLAETKDVFHPSAEQQLASTGLAPFVKLHRMQTGYTWFLHDEIQRLTVNDHCQPYYDLCIIDGPKNWTIDGCAFFLVDKILKEGSWIIFDDYLWTYASADRDADATDGITHRSLSADERRIPQIREVFELIVKQHPHYGEFRVCGDGNWAMARKTSSATKNYSVVYDESIKDFVGYACRKLANRFFAKAK